MLSAPPDWLELAMTRHTFGQYGFLRLPPPQINCLEKLNKKIRERERAFHLIEKLILAVVGR